MVRRGLALLVATASLPLPAWAQSGPSLPPLIPPSRPAAESAPSAAPAPDELLDDELFALAEALTATVAAEPPLPPPPVWIQGRAWRRQVSRRRLLEPIARDLDGVLEVLPTLQGSFRGRVGGLRFVDELRVDGLPAGRLEAWSFEEIEVRRAPTAADGPRPWISDAVARGWAPPRAEGWTADGAIRGRTADRSGGLWTSLGGRAGPAAVRVSARVDHVEAARVRTGTVSVDRPATSSPRVSVTSRAHLWGRRGEPWRVELGHDYDEGGGSPLHLAQATLRGELEEVSLRVTAGLVSGEAADRVQASGLVRWTGEERRELEVFFTPAPPSVLGEPTQGSVTHRRIRRYPAPLFEGGAFLEHDLNVDLTRVEGWVRTGQILGPLLVDLSGRLSALAGAAAPTTIPNLDLDARAELQIASVFGLWARFARSQEFRLGGGASEEVLIFEGGPHLKGRFGWLTLSVWGARGDRLGSEGLSADLWGLAAEGALEWRRWSVAGAVHRAAVDEDPGGSSNLAPVTQGRFRVRAGLPEVGGFFELGARVAFESVDSGRDLFLPQPAEGAPWVVLAARAGAELGAGFYLHTSLENAVDVAFTPIGTGPSELGIDFRLALGWRR